MRQATAIKNRGRWYEEDRAPPALRGMQVLRTFPGQYYSNGADGFVRNCDSIVPPVIEAFAHVGAGRTENLLAEIDSRNASEREASAWSGSSSSRQALAGSSGGPGPDERPVVRRT